MREKQGYREQLACILTFTEGKNLLSLKDVREFTGVKDNRTYEVDWLEFEEFGRQALALQTMKSFIAETSLGRTVEVNVEIMEE